MLVMGLAMMRLYTKVLEVHYSFVTPAIPVLCVVGAFAINKNLIDVVVMFFRRTLTVRSYKRKQKTMERKGG